MLPFFFRHYDDLVDQYFVYDTGSTDESLALLEAHGRVQVERLEITGDSFVDFERRVSDQMWQKSRGKADWVMVTDIDEHLHRPDLVGYLKRCQAEGITAIRSFGFEMVAEDFPAVDGKLIELVTRGGRVDGLDRLCIFSPDAISATHFGPGREKAWPEGHVVWPASSELLLLHYKRLGLQYLLDRNANLAQGMRPGDLKNGWGVQFGWSAQATAEDWARSKADAVTVPGLGELSHITPDRYRGDEKIVEESGLLDGDWYTAHYQDLAESDVDPLIHFCSYGWREGRQPNFYFDPGWYEANYPQVAAAGINPLVHYVREGERLGHSPSEHFDTAWYRERHRLGVDESPLRHYLLRRHSGLVAPVPDVNLDVFCKSRPEIRATGRDPYEEYIKEQRLTPEEREARQYPSFDMVLSKLGLDPGSGIYPAQVPWGSFLGVIRLFLERYPVDEVWYRDVYPDVDAAIRAGDMESASIHFIEHGFFEGRDFRPRDTQTNSENGQMSRETLEAHERL